MSTATLNIVYINYWGVSISAVDVMHIMKMCQVYIERLSRIENSYPVVQNRTRQHRSSRISDGLLPKG